MANNLLSKADILLRLGVDASGVEAEVASKLSATERRVVASGNRMSAAVAADAQKVQAAQLRVVAAQERYAAVLQREGATRGQVASAQASLISSRRTLARETDRATVSTERLERKTSLLGSTVKGFVAGFAGFAAFGFLRDGVQELSEFQSTLAQSEAGIRSTGGAANVTADDIQNLASKVQAYSGQQDEVIAAGENLLLTFRKVRNEVGAGNKIFDRATIAAADLSARGFGTMETSAKTLGKALQDPISGLTALRRTGVQFTKDQTDTIKALVATGDLLSAQKIILREVETQVGGSARAFGQTLPGQLARSRRALEDFEQGTVAAMAPALEALAGVATFFREHKTARDAALFAGGTVAALALVNKGVKLYQEVSVNVLRRAPAQVVANGAVAGSYERIAVAANNAAAAEGRAAAAGSAGGRFGIARLALGNPVSAALTLTAGAALVNAHRSIREGGKEADALADQIATPAQLASAKKRLAELRGLAADHNITPVQVLEANRLQGVISRAEPRIKADAKKAGEAAATSFKAGFVASDAAKAFAEFDLFSSGQRGDNISNARKALDDALAARSKANEALAEARTRTTGGTPASASDIRIAELRLESARSRLGGSNGSTASERASVLSAERTLNDLRSKGKATAEQTADAEGRVRDAIASQKDAQDRVNEARKALDAAHGISAQEALRRIRGDVKSQTTLRDDLKKILGAGGTQESLAALKQLEAESPGTIHRIATSTGQKFQGDFADALDRINKRSHAIEKLFDGAETLAERRGRKVAEALRKGVAEGLEGFDFRDFFSTLPGAPSAGPTKAVTRGVRGKLDAQVRDGGFPAT